MSARNSGHLTDILEAAKLAQAYVGGKTRQQFLDDVQCQDAVIRRLEIIGEAARHVSRQTRARFPEVPWSDLVGMRNVLVHGYGEVDLLVVWNTIRRDVPQLVESLEHHLSVGD